MQICPAILQQIVQCHADIVLILTKVEHCDAVTYADVGGVYILLAANGAEAAVTTVIDLVKMPVHGIDGPVPYMGFPVKLSAHPDIEYKAAPVLGGDNEDIYGHVLGKSKEELEELKKKNAI